MPGKIVCEYTYDSIEDYIERINDQKLSSNIVYRGVSKSTYSLIPSLYREKVIEKTTKWLKNYCECKEYRPMPSGPDVPTDVMIEKMSILAFYETANYIGLKLPTIKQSIESNTLDIQENASKYGDIGTFYEEWKNVAAIAQHYGLPTRLLDWTYDPWTALYFSSRRVLEEKTEEKDSFAIFELNIAKASQLMSNSMTKLKFITSPYHENPNLFAQHGLFSYTTCEGNYMKTMEEILQTDKNSYNLDTVLIKHIIPYGNNDDIRKILRSRRLTYEQYHPSFSGVVKGLMNYEL